MKILILVSNFPPEYIGGTEIQSYKLAKSLAKRGHDVYVITRSYMDLPKREMRDGFKIIRFFHLDIKILSFFTHLFFSFYEVFKLRKKIDILYCMMIVPNGLVGFFVRKVLKKSSITWVRGGDWYISRKKIIDGRIISFVLNKSPKIFTQTEKIKKEILSEYPKSNIYVVPNGIEITKEKINGDKIIFVGNLIERKGVEYLIRSVRGLNTELLIVGDGPKRDYLERISGKNVKFVGKVLPNDLKKYMKQGKILILPSKIGEGLPNVILEAMSFGIPVIATNLAGITNVIKHGETGFIVEPRNSNELRKYIKILLNDEKTRERMSKKCKSEIKKYSWDNVIRNLISSSAK